MAQNARVSGRGPYSGILGSTNEPWVGYEVQFNRANNQRGRVHYLGEYIVTYYVCLCFSKKPMTTLAVIDDAECVSQSRSTRSNRSMELTNEYE